MLTKIVFFVLVLVIALSVILMRPAYAHFYGGQTQTFGDYAVVCVPSPDPPVADDNNTKLQFSVLQLGDNIYNIQSALTVKDSSGNSIIQTDYRTYEFSDITIPGVLPKPGNYNVTLATKIVGNSKYGEVPLVASFNVVAMDPRTYIPFDEILMIYIIPPVAAAGGFVLFLRSKGKLKLCSKQR